MNNVRVGSYVGTGASLNIEVGFVPAYLILFNVTDGDVLAHWADGMAAGTALEIGAAAVTNPDNGITRYVGDATHGPGFSTGTDYSENAKTFRYIAFRATEPSTQPAGIAAGASS